MNRTSFNALIVAAGRPRQRETFSPTQKLGSLSVIQRIIHTFQQAGASSVYVVTGYRGEELERHLARSGVIFIRNNRWEDTDMMDSVKLGLTGIENRNEKLLFTPSDIPLFTLSTVRKLLNSDAFQAAVPDINGRSGHPLMLSADLIPSLLSYDGDKGLKDAVQKAGAAVVSVNVEDEGILFDAEHHTDCEDLLHRHNRQPFFPSVSVTLERELPFFDRDTALLLRLVNQVGSVRRACSLTGISYSKGWKILNEMELQSGITIINRQAGGHTGGSTELTDEGSAFLTRFEHYEKKVAELAEKEFYRIFPEMRTEE